MSVIVETYRESGSGLHGSIHVRPVAGQDFPTSLRVRCPKKFAEAYPLGTRFRIDAKLTDREGGQPFLSTYHGWPFDVLGKL
ncbi:hypothetical protein P7D22_13600 [Lichenihabitans sp. Uapishka_5]|uniref:hypothetical protein n=1 Tax=Lichenihabitans sp. Uapishka_5 TaxID=3037302 RepID=UPI0029E7EAC0|nr:hypothetical protein [Lichenihabitans sp. Uapishka_5]MDX7952210.1 hypothetical protein [Lichenihabitans sp. Uapishka_5]